VDCETLRAFIYFIYTDQILIVRLKLEKIEEGRALQKLRDFAHKQNFPFLVGLCNVLLDPISRETGISFTDSSTISIVGDSTFKNDLDAIVGNGIFSDIDFIVKSTDSNLVENGEESSTTIPAHKPLLISRSDYFKAMFDPSKKLRESQSRAVRLDMNKNVLLGILSYLYGSIIPKKSLNARFATSLLEASTQLMIEPLVLTCEMFLIEHMDRSNVCSLFMLADTLNADFLREECLDFIIRNYADMRKADELSSLEPTLLSEVEKCHLN